MPDYEVEWGDRLAVVEVAEGEQSLCLTHGGRTVGVEMIQIAPGRYQVRLGERTFHAGIREEQDALLIDLGPDRYRVRVRRRLPIPTRRQAQRTRAQALTVTAPMPGLLVSLEVQEGQSVRAEQPVAILEAMKMRMEIRAPAGGTVRRVHARAGVEVTGGQVLVTLE